MRYYQTMHPDKTRLQELLDRYLEGSTSAEEEQLLWLWLWQLDVRETVHTDANQEEAIRLRMREHIFRQLDPAPHTRRPGKHIRLRRSLAAAAAILVAVIVPATLFHRAGHHQLASRPEPLFYSSDSRHIKTLLLPDSSQVTLNLNSSVRWEEKDGQRQLSLEGEAWFNVHQDPAHPFIVHTGEVHTTVLGTAFDIEYYGREQETRVALLQGKIRLNSKDSGYVLTPGQMIRYDRRTHHQELQNISVDLTAWQTGGLVFNDIPLNEALNRLAERYNLHLRYDPRRMAGRRVTAVFHRATWEGVLANILFLQDLHYKVKDTLIHIY